MDSRQFLFLNHTKLLDFLYTAQSGSAHNKRFNFRTFLVSLGSAIVCGSLQVSIFSFYRNRLKHIYQPNCLNEREEKRANPLPTECLAWILPVVFKRSLQEYYPLGLDIYFVLRYLLVLMRFFSIVTLLSVLVLLPTNYTGGTGCSPVEGFDKLTMANISVDNNSRYIVHFIAALTVIGLLHFIIVQELQNYYVIHRQQNTRRTDNAAVLIENVPKALQSSEVLMNIFLSLPGSVRKVWFVYNFEELEICRKKFERLRDKLEMLECNYLSKLREKLEKQKRKSAIQLTFIQHKIERPTLKISIRVMGYTFDLPYYSTKKDAIDYYSDETTKLHYHLSVLKSKIEKEHVYLVGKVIIQFEKRISAHIVKQINLLEEHSKMNYKEVISNPHNILWENLSLEKGVKLTFERHMASSTAVAVTLLWVIPISVIGMVVQLPYLGTLIPFLGWLDSVPVAFKEFCAGLLPTIALSALTEAVPPLFNFIGTYKRAPTGLRHQMDLQKWLFMFFFFHTFLVVTISSGIIMIIESLVNNPVSIPALLATDLPKASNFFHSFFLIRGLIYFGNTLMQPRALLGHFKIRYFRSTPRQIEEETVQNRKVVWGVTYPTLTVFACIGIIYSVITPLILVFCSLAFFLILSGFKYNLIYVYHTKKEDEMDGQLYPTALLQLYAGIYCLELALIGFFMTQGCLWLAAFMILSFLLTIVANTNLKRKYHDQSMLFISDSEIKQFQKGIVTSGTESKISSVLKFLLNMLFKIIPEIPNDIVTDKASNLEEKFEGEEVSLIDFTPGLPHLSIWVPSDAEEISMLEIMRLKACGFKIVT